MSNELKKLGERFDKPLLTTITDLDYIHVNQNGVDYAAEARNFRTTLKVDLITTIPGSGLDATQGTLLKAISDFNTNASLLLFKYTALWTVTADVTTLDLVIPEGSIRLPNKPVYGVNGTTGTIPDGGGVRLTYNPNTNIFTYNFLTDLSVTNLGDNANTFIIAVNIGGSLYTVNASLLEWIKEIGGSSSIANEIHAATEKTIIVNDDEFGIWDSVTGLLNKITWGNLVNWIQTNITKPLNTLTIKARQLSGFLEPRDVIVTYNSTNRTVTLTGNLESFHLGIPMTTIDSDFVTGWVSPAHDVPVGTKTYFLSYNGTAFVFSETIFNFGDLQIAWVYRDGVNVCLRECHGLMDKYSHIRFHQTIGTTLASGGDIGALVLNSTTAANRRPTLTAAVIIDEDLTSDLDALAAGAYTWLNLNGANSAALTVDRTDIIPLSTNQPYWNQFTGGVWQQTLFAANEYGKILLYAIPTTADAECKKARFIFVQPQTVSGTLTTIQGIAPSSVNFASLLDVIPEIVCIGEIIIRYTSGNWVIISHQKIIGSSVSQSVLQGNFLSTVATDTTLSGNGSTGDPLSVESGLIISSATEKTTPIDADKIGFWDSVDIAFKSMTFANLKTWLTGLYVGITGTQTITGVKTFAVSSGTSMNLDTLAAITVLFRMRIETVERFAIFSQVANNNVILRATQTDGDIVINVGGADKFKYKADGSIQLLTAPVATTLLLPTLVRNATTGAIENLTLLTQTSVVSSATPTPTGATRENEYFLTALAADAVFAAPSGTPLNGNTLIIRVKDNGTARSLGFNAIYRAVGVTLPTTTVVNKTLYLGCIYNSADSKWDVVSVVQEV